MNKAVLISIQPQWCAMILRGEKTVELRKTAPKIPTPFKSYIYCTNGGRPLVLGDVFRGDWDMDYVQTYGWSRAEADRIWGVMNGKVIAEFVCDGVEKHYLNSATCRKLSELSCVPSDEIHIYAQPHDFVYGWHISDLVIYEKPKQLSDFYRWSDWLTDIRPCQNGKPCENLIYDYTKNCEACAIDFDGTDCPYLKLQRPPQSWCYVEELE